MAAGTSLDQQPQHPQAQLAPTFRVVGEREQADTGGTDAGTEDGDPQGISPKEGDVLTDPAQRLYLIQQPVIALGSLVPRAQEPCEPRGAWLGMRKQGVS